MAGVWEDARHAYVNEVLIRRTGCAAALAVLLVAMVQRLLGAGAIAFAVRVDCRAADQLPQAHVRVTATIMLRPSIQVACSCRSSAASRCRH